MTIILYKSFKFTYINEKYNLNEVLSILDHDLQEENLYVTKDELLFYLNFNERKDQEFINFINNNFTEPLLDIDSFLISKNISLFDKKNFKSIWNSLKYRKEILITDDLLNLMGFKPSSIDKYIELLKKNKIDFQEINSKNKKCQEYIEIQNFINSVKPYLLNDKKWLLLDKSNLVNSFSYLNDYNKKRFVIKSFFQIEQIFNMYNEYVKNYEKTKLDLNLKKINQQHKPFKYI